MADSDDSHLPIGFTRDDMEAVGRVILDWNEIEKNMVWIVCRLLEVSMDLAMLIMSSPSVPSQVSILRSICDEKLKDDTLKRKLFKTCDKILKLSNFRNEIAHGFWWDHIWQDDSRTIALQRKGNERFTSMEVFYEKAAEVTALRKETWTFLSQLPRKDRPRAG